MKYEYVRVAEKAKYIELVLSRPKALNALSTPMLREVLAAFSQISKSSLPIVVLKGEGRAFCVGADVKERERGMSFELYYDRVRTLQAIASCLRSTDKIIIALLHGHVVGGGLVMSLYADIRIAAENTVFRLPEVDVGSTLLCGGHKVLIETAGPAKMRELLLLGEPFTAEEAERMQMIHKRVPFEELENTLDIYVNKLASKSPGTLKVVKKAINRALDEKFEDMIDHEIYDALNNFCR